ncbi:MAG: serine dehydratase subunit alpha family protein [Candidatus Schekmanbacteria bacterium]|nr:serine dehydratase subunit alpha family protein [Candidatus Schekmanbacteria bacterium]
MKKNHRTKNFNLLKAVLKHEVFPAVGCTEPIAVAYAASIAGKVLKREITEIQIKVDPGIYKNGFAVMVPNTDGEHGNLIAGVLGALIRKPELKMEILKSVNQDILKRAKELIRMEKAHIICDRTRKRFYIEVSIKAGKESSMSVIEGSHTNLICLEHNNKKLPMAAHTSGKAHEDLKPLLRKLTIADLIDLAQNMDREDYKYIKQGVAMNLRIAKAGQKLKKVGHYVSELVTKGYLVNDVISTCEVLTTSAADARMAGLNYPVMSSGGSGNQGIVAILVPYAVGKRYDIADKTIVQSIALSHLVNSYIKCFTGELSPLCGCAIAAGVGAAAAIVYQQAGKDIPKMTLAVNNLISDLGGMLCDGAKAGCALKVGSSTNSAIRSAYMALNNHGITHAEGFVGNTAEETIWNLSAISKQGMSLVDNTMLGIMMDKLSNKAVSSGDRTRRIKAPPA